MEINGRMENWGIFWERSFVTFWAFGVCLVRGWILQKPITLWTCGEIEFFRSEFVKNEENSAQKRWEDLKIAVHPFKSSLTRILSSLNQILSTWRLKQAWKVAAEPLNQFFHLYSVIRLLLLLKFQIFLHFSTVSTWLCS